MAREAERLLKPAVVLGPLMRPAAAAPRLHRTVGSFDGVHLGHQAVLREIARAGASGGTASVLVTFEPHPLEVVNPQAAPPLLTTGPERREILAQTPLDYVVLPPVRPAPGGVRAGAVRPRRPAGALRHAGAGDRPGPRVRTGPERRRRYPAEAGHERTVRRGCGGRGRCRATSTSPAPASVARSAAAISPPPPACSGRPYSVSGVVGEGERRGRQIGVPTINLTGVPPQKLLPPDGVYAVRVEWRGGRRAG